METYKEFLLIAKCAKKKEPNEYSFYNNEERREVKGVSYACWLETSNDMAEFKLTKELYESMQVGFTYALEMTVRIDNFSGANYQNKSGIAINRILHCVPDTGRIAIVPEFNVAIQSVQPVQPVQANSADLADNDSKKKSNK